MSVETPATPPGASRARLRRAETEERVSPLELFFDLVFVFAITQTTAFMAEDPTFGGMGRGLLVLAAVWWAWTGYAWLTNAVDPEIERTRLVVFAAMAAMLVVALATPRAFGDDAVLFGVAYLLVRQLQVLLYATAAWDVPDLLRQVRRLAVPSILSPALIIVAGAALDGTARDVAWIAAIVFDYGLVYLAGAEGWTMHPGHFAERHGLIMLIAFGESIVAVGVGAEELTTGVVTAAVLGIAITAAMWWAYFDVVALYAERHLREAQGVEQVRIARDSYSYLHLPMVAGIVLFALGTKKVAAHPGDVLKAMPAVAVCSGLALYLLAHVAFRLRNTGTWAVRRVVAAGLCLAVIPLARSADALVAYAVLAAIMAGVIGYEVVRYGEVRRRFRAEILAGED